MDQDHETEKVLHVSLSHDFTSTEDLSIPPARSLILCSTKGIRVFDLLAGRAPLLQYRIMQYGAVLLAERLLQSSSVLFVKAGEPRRLFMHSIKDSKLLDFRAYDSEVLAVELSHIKIVVLLEHQVIVHCIGQDGVECILYDAIINPRFRPCALTFKTYLKGSTFLAYPTRERRGDVVIFDVNGLEKLHTITAHDSDIVALSFNPRGNLVATASEKGTVIRVFTVYGRELVHELQRGLMRFVTIQSLAFDLKSTMLSCSSNKETVHIFNLNCDAVTSGDNDDTLMSYLIKSIVGGGVKLLPSSMSKVFKRSRAFATVTLPRPAGKTITSWSDRYGSLLLISEDGLLRTFDADAKKGGEWPVRSTRSLLDDTSECEHQAGGI